MIGIEDKVWMQVEDCERIYPIADEDLERDNATKPPLSISCASN